MTSDELIAWFRQNNVLVWGGNVAEPEGFQGNISRTCIYKCEHKLKEKITVSNTLQAATYPFMAIIALQSSSRSYGTSKMSVVDRIEGPATPAEVIQHFENVNQRYGRALNRMRHEREQREMERRLRQEQDQAYRESLRADQEKVNVP